MLLILPFLFLFFFFPLTAWAYFDPGFGGYLFNSIISFIIAGFAFVSAAVIYFFRTIIGQRLFSTWQKYQRLCIIIFLFILSIGIVVLRSTIDHPHLSDVRSMDSQRIFKGYVLFDGKLINEKGRIVKKWSHGYFDVIDKNGDYYDGNDPDNPGNKEPAWGRYTWDGRVIWEKHFWIHHELYLSPKGTIFTFTNEVHDYNGYKVDFAVILEYDKNGNQLQRYSFWDHLKEFQPYHAKFGIDVAYFAGLPFTPPWPKTFRSHSRGLFDYFHINSFYMIPPNPLEGKDPAFRRGNWLISILHGSMVFILDQDTKKILWHAVGNEIEGSLEGQHSASMLPDGDILLFENGFNRKASRILIIDPLTRKIKWQYKSRDFFSPWAGFVQALPNGDLFVTDSKIGHAFELTPDKKIVWEYYNNRSLTYRMTYYPKEMIDRFLLKKGLN